jgi:dCMP deaminase
MNNRISLDAVHIEMAQALSKRAACTRRQVGALVVDKDGRIASSGYNGAPSGEVHCTDGGCPRGQQSYEEVPAFSSYESCVAIHAEANALIRAGEKAVGGTLIITCPPCHECARLAKAARVARIIYPEILGEEND